MNSRVERKLKTIKGYVENIKAYAECILEDIEDVEDVEDMFIIDQGFDRIIREARVAIEKTREAEDDFEIEEIPLRDLT